ncbi:RHS repeat-associated core domain-containing protein, partial [Akkermansia muciniphila]|uniref:RHS repeat domain-containing protein n=1 Tax=Akkermansia muciniphila TaxID=239935 RepID=UPI00319E0D6F
RSIVTTWGYNLKKGVNNSVSYSDSTSGIQYAYNYLNQLTRVTDASGTRTITYTPYNEPDTDSITIAGTSYQLQEHYDTYGRSSGYTLKQGTGVLQEVSQGYEADGRLASAGIMHEETEQRFAYGYLAGSNLLSSLAMPDGIVRELSYEQRRDLLSGLDCRLGETGLVSRTQSYDALGRPVTRTQQRGTEPARSDSFSYNGRNELTGATLGAAPYGYSYDNIGNRKTAQEPAGELAYAANELNQYTRIEENEEAPFVPTYDASGNQTLIKTSTGIWTVVYNAANRAVSFTSRNGNTIIECGYDYQGRRYMKKVTENGTVASHERYLYRGYLQIAALDMLDNRNVLRTLLWDPLEPVVTRPLALVQDNILYCYGVDFNKNVTEVFDAQGTIAAAYDYSPYGTATRTGRLVQPVQWSGEMHDEEPALVYYNYRYYNPKDGRWINRDPIAEEGGWNLYAFLGNSTQDKVDALGLKKGFIKTGDPCSKCCKECKRSQERPIIQDAGTKGINVKASVKSPNFTSECEHNNTCKENCCYVVYTWFDCYNKTCYSQTGDTFNRKIRPLRGEGSSQSALGVSVQAYKWCSCNRGKWKCHSVIKKSNIILYKVDNPQNPKSWILTTPPTN